MLNWDQTAFLTVCLLAVFQGMACVGRTKMCTIVPPNHFGSIPGIEVGSLWKFRVQVSSGLSHRYA